MSEPDRRLLSILAPFAAFLFMLPTGCSEALDYEPYGRLMQRRQKYGLPEEENTRLVKKLADEVGRAYEQSQYLTFDIQTVWPGDVRTKAKTAMAPGKLKTQVFLKVDRVYVMTFKDGLIEEYKARHSGVPELHSIRSAERPDGTGDLKLLKGLEEHGCALGGYCHTWLGPNASKVAFFKSRISTGEYLGTTIFDGRTCQMLLCPTTPGYGGIELFYIRPDHFIARQDTYRPSVNGTMPQHKRIRRFTNLRTDVLPPETWSFERPNGGT